MATVRRVSGTALHLACFPDVCCPRSQRVDVKELLSTEDENTKYYSTTDEDVRFDTYELKICKRHTFTQYWVWTATGDLQTHMRVLSSSDAGQFQLLCLLLPCAVPSAFPVPFALSRGPASKNVILVSFAETTKSYLFSKKVSHMAKSLAGAHKP